jgi:hypothetical protein
MPESALNRYSVRPVASTRVRPKRLLASLTVAVWVGGVVVVFDGGGGEEAVAAPPPQAATARAASGITAALPRKVMGLLRVISLLWLGRSTVAATRGDRITQRVVRDREIS